MDKHNWNNSTINSICWQAYHQSLKKLTENEKRCIRKFIHNLWPTLYREQKYKTHPSSLCKKCRLYNEKEDHILRCRNPTRQHIRDKWRKEIEEYLSKSHTPPAVKQYMCQGFFAWLENGRYINQPILNQDKAVEKVIKIQENIGWPHFVRARIAIEWGHIVNDHITKHSTQKISAEQWCAKLLAINWKHILSMWHLRNQETMGANPEEAAIIQKQNLIDEVIYLREKHVSPHGSYILIQRQTRN
jgi:hypothetical protein